MTNQTTAARPVRMPGTVLAAGVAMLVHTLVFGAGTVFLFLEAKSVTDHGQNGAETYTLGGVMGLVLVAGIALSAAMVLRGHLWARILGLVLEGLFLFGGLIAFVAAALVARDPVGMLVTGLLYVVLPVAVGWLLFTRSARAYFVR
jgi:hypothetical protein